jgi:hypothetical protein
LPPTDSTSLILRFSKGTTRAVASKRADMDKLQEFKKTACEVGRRRAHWAAGEEPVLCFLWTGWRANGRGQAVFDNGAIVGPIRRPLTAFATAPSPISKPAFHIMPTAHRFFISDGTGITAETFGNAILAQFEIKPRHVRLPFVDTVDKAHQAVRQINHTAELEGKRPIVFTTLVNMEVLRVRAARACCWTCSAPSSAAGDRAGHQVQPPGGRFSDASKSQAYDDRIEAINFSLAHDDGQSNRDLEGPT